jgi:hypothetical protein
MRKAFLIPALVLGSLMALVPQTASARDHDRDWARHERHERWVRHHHYRYGYYDRYGYWHQR